MKSNLAVFIVVAIVLIASSAYVVDEREQVVVTQFGKVVGEPKTNSGLYFRVPFIQNANYFPKNILQWDGDQGQIPTLDKTYIWVDTFARWKIVDPVKFFQTVNNINSALARLDDIIDSATRNMITSNSLIEAVRVSNRKLDTFEIGMDVSDMLKDEKRSEDTYKVNKGRREITKVIIDKSQPKLTPFGILLVDVKIKRINYVEQVRQSVYGRMIAERKQIAEKFRSEGKGEASKIVGDKERDLKKITSEAFRIAQEIKGKADAEATKIYAEAYMADPELYAFVKTLETYNQIFDDKSTFILSTDSELLKYLKAYK
ncbi:MAG: protease modulator HflC [Desulfobacterales bacterium]|nr:protease modulator HflC [Desulfobacterales bacterium]